MMAAGDGRKYRSEEALYLDRLVRRCFGSGSPDGIISGRNAFYEAIKAELERRGYGPAAIRMKLTTVTGWCSNYAFKNAREKIYRDVAIDLLLERLPDSEGRELMRDRLCGLAPVPDNIAHEYQRQNNDASGLVVQHLGTLLGSAVRSLDAYFDNAPETEERSRAEQELNTFRALFHGAISSKDFAVAVMEEFHAHASAEFRMKLLGYALQRLEEREDLERSEMTGRSWGGVHASAARNLYRTAWIFRCLRFGNDDDLKFALTFQDELVQQMRAQRASALPGALALCALMNAYGEYPGPLTHNDELVTCIKEYMLRESHDVLMLRCTINMLGKLYAHLSESLVATGMLMVWSKMVDDTSAHPICFDVKLMNASFYDPSGRSRFLGDAICELYEKYDTWIIRYPLLQLAQRKSAYVEMLVPTAREILQNNRTGDIINAEAICYLARLQTPEAKQVLFEQIGSGSKHAHRAMVALMIGGSRSDIARMIELRSAAADFEREAMYRVFAKKSYE